MSKKKKIIEIAIVGFVAFVINMAWMVHIWDGDNVIINYLIVALPVVVIFFVYCRVRGFR